jgi:hypothetical protein
MLFKDIMQLVRECPEIYALVNNNHADWNKEKTRITMTSLNHELQNNVEFRKATFHELGLDPATWVSLPSELLLYKIISEYVHDPKSTKTYIESGSNQKFADMLCGICARYNKQPTFFERHISVPGEADG